MRKLMVAGLALWMGLCGVCLLGGEREFEVLVYNVENLFDVDGIAIYDEYSQSEAVVRFPYHGRRLLNKVRAHAEVISRTGGGAGADIIALQELEWDRSPGNESVEALLKRHRGQSLEKMLGGRISRKVADLPSVFFLMKALEEKGLSGYRCYAPKQEPSWKAKGLAHKNVVLSRFPARKVKQHPIDQARDILEVWLEIDGNLLVIFNNHWKSGASNASLEPVRVGNAQVLRNRLDRILKDDPEADVLLVGDFNTSHDQDLRFGERVSKTALHDVLGSQGSEKRLFDGKALLYNLWYELPPEGRGSEVYAGEWGTLMQMLVTRGLYDGKGVQYVDQSFRVYSYPGLNADPETGAPLGWVNLCDGKGVSDHLPVAARFRTAARGDLLRAYERSQPGDEDDQVRHRRWVDRRVHNREPMESVEVLKVIDECAMLPRIGERFLAELRDFDPENPSVDLGGERVEIYTADYRVRQALREHGGQGTLNLIVEMGLYRGRYQLLVNHPSWVLGS